MDTKKTAELLSIQQELDDIFLDYAKQEFDLHYKNYTLIKPLLEKREKLVCGIEEFWNIAAKNYPFSKDLFSITDDDSINWIERISVAYEDNYFCNAEIHVREGCGIKNKVLKKRFNICTNEIESTKVESDLKCEVFEFFEGEDVDLEVFDSLYELYVNAVFYCSAPNVE